MRKSLGRHVSILLGSLILTLTTSILVGYAPTLVAASPGGIIWAQSEQVGTHDQQVNGVAVDSSGVYVVG